MTEKERLGFGHMSDKQWGELGRVCLASIPNTLLFSPGSAFVDILMKASKVVRDEHFRQAGAPNGTGLKDCETFESALRIASAEQALESNDESVDENFQLDKASKLFIRLTSGFKCLVEEMEAEGHEFEGNYYPRKKRNHT